MADKAGVHGERGRNLSESIAQQLGERIIRGELSPGTRLLEVQLAHELGASRAPLREALRMLDKQRLVDIKPRRGATVSRMGAQEIRWTYQVMIPLFEVLARATALNWTPENLPPVYSVTEKMIAAVETGDVEGYYERNFAFARACAPIAGNPLLASLMLELEPSLRRILYLSRRQRARAMSRHRDLVRSLMRHVAEREPDEAAAVIREIGHLEKRLALEPVIS